MKNEKVQPLHLASVLLERVRHRERNDSPLFIDDNNEISGAAFVGNLNLLTTSCLADTADHRVVICMNDSIALALSFYGVMLAGGIPIVINPRLRAESISYILADSDARLIISDEEYREKFENMQHSSALLLHKENNFFRHSQLIFSLDCQLNATQNPINGVVSTQGHCFWQYTSGTSGDPKAVMHTHEGILDMCEQFAGHYLQINEEDIIYSIPKTFFGYGMGNSLIFPLYGNCTALLTQQWPSVDKILSNIKQHKPSLLFGGPAIYKMMLDDPRTAEVVNIPRLFYSAGSPLLKQLHEEWFAKYDKYIIDGIGATEVGHVFIGNDISSPKFGKVGKCLPGYECKLLAIEGYPKHTGILCVKGGSVAAGYWNKADKQEEKFSDGWYITGDIFSVDEEGNYEFIGREDDLFKVKGRWVEPVKIENWLLSKYSCISEAAVVPFHENYDVQCALFIVLGESAICSTQFESELRGDLSNGLHSFEVPRQIHFLESLTKNDNGKLERKKLIEKITLHN
ncbi:AMP-binding protein [Pseudoalteromonas sp. OOF1S-7]|uniref:AMP-binding protein n=1 Tax=Pseudoalteromonas sp. OOF1S-7 TaxID=2917757 RepID=UPI001EF70DCB|nr:AMP-binding protein [Pseudoalteromonas sp. OOF1S-7]